MSVPVVWLTFNPETIARGYWDQGMLEDIFSNEMWKPGLGYEFKHWDQDELKLPNAGAVVVIPARHNLDHVGKIQAYIKQLDWCIIILTGDEESRFPYDQLKHPKMKLWVMQPVPGRTKADVVYGSGYPPQARPLLKKFRKEYEAKPLDWFFSGQITHKRREEAADVLDLMLEREDITGEIHKSKAFTEGLEHAEYFKKMASAKAVPCPSGPSSPDSFRVYEALEAGAIPIADDLPPKDFPEGYWNMVLGDVPFKILKDYSNLEGYICDVQREYPAINNRTFAWWQNYKRELVYTLRDQLIELSGEEPEFQDMTQLTTVLIPTSPVPANPSTEHIERTIADVRAQLPFSEIIIMIDGVREEQSDRKDAYNEYINRLLWLCNHEWFNVLPLVFEDHQHQANMTRRALELVRTPTITFVEHDAPLVPDEPIEWEPIIISIMQGHANIVRFHFEGVIPEAHTHLMIDGPQNVNGAILQKTVQWSQRPHIASTAFYRHIIDTYFGPESRTMIEDVIHGVVDSAYREEGIMGWNLFKLWIYHPDGGNIKRSYHIDARGKDPKYGMKIAYKGETPRFAPQPKTTESEPGK